MIDIKILEKLNAPSREQRLKALKEEVETACFPKPVDRYINNHIHTTYSFSPYSPTAAVYAARAEGLSTAGIVDHDSIAGAHEFIEAAKIAGIPATVGMECRASMKGTYFADKTLNNPDQPGIAYMTLQSVPHEHIDALNEFFAPYRKLRVERTKAMTENINELLKGTVHLDFEADVLSLSLAGEGGGITERHLMYALAKKLTECIGKGEKLIAFLKDIGIELSAKQISVLNNTENYFYEYDLLGILKSAFISKIYIPAAEECPNVTDVIEVARKYDALLCYAYLGDVTSSVTGDKKAQKFEDEYLDELFECFKELGVKAMTYMPTRNTKEQLERVRNLCEKHGMIQVCGEDINSPGQSFVVRAMDDPTFKNLIDSTWMLIEHEINGKKFV